MLNKLKLNLTLSIKFFIFLIATFFSIIVLSPIFLNHSNFLTSEIEWHFSNNKPIINDEISVIFVGDIMLDRYVEKMIKEKGNNDFKFPFLKIADNLKKADILIGNLEGPISDKGNKVGSIYSFRMNPEAIDGLIFSGFDILSLANNHIFDYGKIALEDTLIRLRKSKIDYIGAGFNENEAYSPLIKNINQTKLGFLAYTNFGTKSWQAQKNSSGIAWISNDNLSKIKQQIQLAKKNVDILIIYIHWGDEYKKLPNKFQVNLAKTFLDSGADLIVGHHPHVVQPIERYQDKYIAYSLGNFIFDQNFSQETMEGLALKVIIKDKKIKELIPIKIKINKFFQAEILN